MITKRITTQKRLVSQFDDAYITGFARDKQEAYLDSLDIEKLGSFKDLKEQPTIFKVDPLKTQYEYLIYSDSIDPWLIFSTHVKALENCGEIKLSFSNDIIDEIIKEQIPPRIVQDIAHMIISIANQSGSEVFFSQSVASLRYAQAVLHQHAQKKALESVRMVDAINKSSD